MLKRLCTLALCLILCLTLAACGGEADRSEGESAQQPAQQEPVTTPEPASAPTPEPTPEPTPAPVPVFAWLDAQATLVQLSDNAEDVGTAIKSTETARAVVTAMAFDRDLNLPQMWLDGEVDVTAFRLIDAAGNEYAPENFGFPMDNGLDSVINRAMLYFLVPNDVALTGMSLRFPDGSRANLDTDIDPDYVMPTEEPASTPAPVADGVNSAADKGIVCECDPATKRCAFHYQAAEDAEHVKVFMMVKGHDGTHLAYSFVLEYWENVTADTSLAIEEFYLDSLTFQVVQDGMPVGEEMSYDVTKMGFPSADMVMVTVIGDVWYEQVMFSDWAE